MTLRTDGSYAMARRMVSGRAASVGRRENTKGWGMADCGDDCRAAAIQLAAVILFMAEPIYLLWHYGFTGGPAHQTGSQILYRTSLSKFDKEMMNHA